MPTTTKVLEVQDVKLEIYKTNPPTLGIYADGIVPTTGWKNGQLQPWVYIQFPPDGIWDFDFVADAPDGPSADVLCPISASYFWHGYPKELKGVRVHASLNSREELLTKDAPREVSLYTKANTK